MAIPSVKRAYGMIAFLRLWERRNDAVISNWRGKTIYAIGVTTTENL